MSPLNLNYPDLLDLFPEHLDPGRAESASFLIWYLENYYRLDSTEAIECVCDQSGDGGIDGIFLDDDDQTIIVFQARIYQSPDKPVGDKTLRTFAGSLTQFRDAASLQVFLEGVGDAKVASLVNRLELLERVEAYNVKGEFLTNAEMDSNAERFLKGNRDISFIGRARLLSEYISDQRDVPIRSPASFDVAGFEITQYTADQNTRAVIAPIKAVELARLDGIADQSLFAYNVRGPLGKTKVNREIEKSIRDKEKHKLFPLFHNGITVIAQELEVSKDSVKVNGYFVVNGAQSLNAIFTNRPHLTENLRILTKFVKLEPTSSLAEMVTKFSNNQNGVKPRDFRANNRTQIRLQNEFAEKYSNQYRYEIKRGEKLDGGVLISNEEAGLYLMAFDLKEPWATHRKYHVFLGKHAQLFGRPEVTADRIVLCQVIREAADQSTNSINNTLLAKYVLTRYLLIYMARQIIEEDEVKDELLAHPENFVREENNRNRLRGIVKKILDEAILDLNDEVDDLGEDFDYRDKLRDWKWVSGLGRKAVSFRQKLLRRRKIASIKDEWHENSA